MNVLIFNWRDIKHPLAGGAEAAVYHHAKYWQKKGARITWFSSSFDGGKSEEMIEGMRIMRRGSHYTVQLYGIFSYLTGKFGNQDIIVDCFHFIPFYTPLFIQRKRIIGLIHEVADKLWFKNIFLPIAVIGYLVERVSFIFYKRIQFMTVSESTKNELLRHGISQEKISVIINGISLPHAQKKFSKEKNPTVTFLGRISMDKGIDEALQAFTVLSSRIPDLRFWIIGKEEKKGEITQLLDKAIADTEMRKKIFYWGFVPEEKKFELLSKSWLLIHPSEKEGWGLTVIEAASQGTPAIGYDVEGLRDSIRHNETGLLVSPHPEALVTAIEDCLSHPAKLRSFSSEASLWAKQFDWEKAGRKSWELLTKQYNTL